MRDQDYIPFIPTIKQANLPKEELDELAKNDRAYQANSAMITLCYAETFDLRTLTEGDLFIIYREYGDILLYEHIIYEHDTWGLWQAEENEQLFDMLKRLQESIPEDFQDGLTRLFRLADSYFNAN